MGRKIGYVMNIDVGDLEKKTILLLESIRKFSDADPFVIVIKPNLKPLSNNTLKYFFEKNVHFHEIEMGNFFTQNIMMSKVFIAFYAEILYDDILDYILLLDNDTIFLNNIEKNLFETNFLIAMRPTDFSDGSLLSFDNCPSVWKYLIKKYNLIENIKWKHKCVQDNVLAYASFNDGFVLERTGAHLFYKWKTMADSLQNDKNFMALLTKDVNSLHYLSQILISLILMKDFHPEDVKILDIKYNFNLQSIFFGHEIFFSNKNWIFKRLQLPLDSLIHIHYHKAFDSKSMLHYFNDKEHVSLLKSFVPFNKSLNLNKKIYRLISKIFGMFKFIQYYIFYILLKKRSKKI